MARPTYVNTSGEKSIGAFEDDEFPVSWHVFNDLTLRMLAHKTLIYSSKPEIEKIRDSFSQIIRIADVISFQSEDEIKVIIDMSRKRRLECDYQWTPKPLVENVRSCFSRDGITPLDGVNDWGFSLKELQDGLTLAQIRVALNRRYDITLHDFSIEAMNKKIRTALQFLQYEKFDGSRTIYRFRGVHENRWRI